LHDSLETVRMVVSYVGTNYAGWQTQRRADTIQARLESALSHFGGGPVGVVGAGRTDSGVHARGQVAHCRLRHVVEPDRLRHAVNALLPADIRVERLRRARAAFNARRDATSRLYLYRLHVGGKPSPFDAPFVARVAAGVADVEGMIRAASHLLGDHDFSSFCGRQAAPGSRRCTLLRLDIRRRGEEILFAVEGNRFLKHQVRNLVGTLAEVGRGRRLPDSLREVLASRDRRRAGPTAPASGLCLVRVRYARR
jgi:tRNA pseudouridine38-40 synthase